MFLKYSFGFLFALVIFLSVLTKLGSCLECYSCSSAKSSFCGDEFDENVKLLIRVCPSYSKVCFRSTAKLSIFGEIVSRGCAKSDKCDNPDLLDCGICTENLCNSSSNLSSFTTIIICFMSILLVLRIR